MHLSRGLEPPRRLKSPPIEAPKSTLWAQGSSYEPLVGLPGFSWAPLGSSTGAGSPLVLLGFPGSPWASPWVLLGSPRGPLGSLGSLLGPPGSAWVLVGSPRNSLGYLSSFLGPLGLPPGFPVHIRSEFGSGSIWRSFYAPRLHAMGLLQNWGA